MKPDSRDVAREWLSREGRSACVTIANRSALRALPLLGSAQSIAEKASADRWEVVALASFRANLTARALASTPLTSNLKLLALDSRTTLLMAANAVRLGTADLAIFAASDAAMCAASGELEAPVAATHALQTVTGGSFASNTRTTALVADYHSLLKGKTVSDLSSSPLWFAAQSAAITEASRKLETFLLSLDHDWDVWLAWYADRVYGRPDNPATKAWLTFPSEFWSADPKLVNAELKRLLDNPGGTLGLLLVPKTPS